MTGTLIDLFNDQVGTQGDAPALHKRVDGQWQTTSWAQYGADVRALALALDARGLGRGSSVAVISGCLPEYFITDVAANAVGAMTASIYQTNSPTQILYVLQNSDASIIFCENDDQVAKVAAIRDEVPGLLVVGYSGENADLSFDALLAQGRDLAVTNPNRYHELCAGVTPGDVACIIYTSGTTGMPKAALIPHSSILTVLEAIDDVLATQADFRVVSYLPLAHIAERAVSLYSQLRSGGQVWFSSINDLRPDLVDAKPTRLMAVPRVWEKLEEALRAKLPDPNVLPAAQKAGVLASLGLDQCEFAVSGGAPISVATLGYFKDLGLQILEVYGMTESTGLSTINPPGKAKIGTVGKAVKGIEVKLADDNEVLIAGANFIGYRKNPQASADTLKDGWVYSGDLGTIDNDGYLSIIGRKKDLIITAGGENISPANIQLLVQDSPYISQAAIIGDRRRFICALITLSEEAINSWAAENGLGAMTIAEAAESPEVKELIDSQVAKANESLARVQQVRKFAILPRDFTVEDGELTPTMKMKRSVIEADYGAIIDEIYE